MVHLVYVLEDEVEHHLSVVPRPVTDVDEPDDVGVVILTEVTEQGDLSENTSCYSK